jgi:hypothetical protein
MGRRNSDAVFLPLKTKARLNAPPTNQPWAWCTFEMLESGAMRSLSVNARRVLDRIRLEHMAHGRLENGRLKVTWLDFEKYGVKGCCATRRASLASPRCRPTPFSG